MFCITRVLKTVVGKFWLLGVGWVGGLCTVEGEGEGLSIGFYVILVCSINMAATSLTLAGFDFNGGPLAPGQ